MFLKKKSRAKFFAALLSMQNSTEKIDLYSKVAKFYGINIKTPDVNYSDIDFTEKDGEIIYGLKSIKGVGETSIPDIINNRPYESIDDAIEKVPKKSLNKRVLTGLIKSGAFDFEDTNRYKLLNHMMDIRKDKDERLIEDLYNKITCINLEKETLGTSLTFTPWFDSINDDNNFINITFDLISVNKRKDKKGKMMAFVKLGIDGQEIDGLAFSQVYCNNVQAFDTSRTKSITVNGKKSDNKIIISKIINFDLKEEIFNSKSIMDIFTI